MLLASDQFTDRTVIASATSEAGREVGGVGRAQIGGDRLVIMPLHIQRVVVATVKPSAAIAGR